MIKNYQTAIVTGASHGIGPFIVRALAKGVTPLMKQIADFRERQREQADASNHCPADSYEKSTNITK